MILATNKTSSFSSILLFYSSVIHGVGEMDVYRRNMKQLDTVREEAPVTPKTAQSERSNLEFDDRPYLLVDLRDHEEFRANHIVSGNYR